ncbi:MAG: hypothetical protein LAO03_05790 [Acidobacteriia bacterium]|nr:hypothetical protein [Terriglobia bacterium]
MSFRQIQGQTESGMRFSADHTGYDRLPNYTNAVLGQDIRTAEFWGKNRYCSTSTNRMTFAPAYDHVHHQTIHGANDLEHYGHHIPWAGSIVQRIGQQAKAHPHITSVVKTVQPQF